MRSRYIALSALALAASLAFASQASAAKSMSADKLSLKQEAGDAVFPMATVLSTGWEAADGYNVGALEPQLGWTASGTNATWASISTTGPFAGARCLRLIKQTSAGTLSLVFSPTSAQPAIAPSQVKAMIKITNDQGADYDFVGQSPSQGFLSWRVKFSWSDAGQAGGPGTIFVLDDVGAGLAFQDTGIIWDLNVYRELKVSFDPTAGVINYFYDGNLIYTGNLVAGTNVEQLVFLHDNFQLSGEAASLDNLNWIDTASDPVPAQSKSWGSVKNLYRQ